MKIIIWQSIFQKKLQYVTSKPTHRQLSNTHNLPSVHLLDYVVDESSSERLLGVTINSDLSWNTQVENVINTCNTFLYPAGTSTLIQQLHIYVEIWLYLKVVLTL